MDEHGPGPAVFDCRGGVRQPFIGVLQLAEQLDVVAPGQIVQRPLDNCLPGPGRRERAHVHQVCTRESGHPREGLPQIAGESFDDLATPAFGLLL